MHEMYNISLATFNFAMFNWTRRYLKQTLVEVREAEAGENAESTFEKVGKTCDKLI